MLTALYGLVSDPDAADAIPRQQTFSAARQGEESPRNRTDAYQHDHFVMGIQARGCSDAGVDRSPRVEAFIRSIEARIASSARTDGYGRRG